MTKREKIAGGNNRHPLPAAFAVGANSEEGWMTFGIGLHIHSPHLVGLCFAVKLRILFFANADSVMLSGSA